MTTIFELRPGPRVTVCRADADLLTPISVENPCGEDLEYDPVLVLLMSRAASGTDAQYGEFFSPPPVVNWAEVERDCRQLLMRTRDIRLLVLLLRCRVRLAGARGLRDGLAALFAVLCQWPVAVHPRVWLDGIADPPVRANALAALTDPEGLLGDVRALSLEGPLGDRFQLRDLQPYANEPNVQDRPPPTLIRAWLRQMRERQCPHVSALDEAALLVRCIDDWCLADLCESRPDLGALHRLLATIAHDFNEVIPRGTNLAPDPEKEPDFVEVPSLPQTDSVARHAVGTAAMAPGGSAFRSRDAALATLRQVQHWFEENEPSSPIGLLLEQAGRLAGKRFADVFHAIPPELVTRWANPPE